MALRRERALFLVDGQTPRPGVTASDASDCAHHRADGACDCDWHSQVDYLGNRHSECET